jgi:metal-sulfur cluster biosynthetic enzyme
MASKEDILARLREVEDPELGVNIVDLGLIYDIEVKNEKEGGKLRLLSARIRMTFTTPACPLMGQILEDVKAKLEVFKDADVEVSVVFDPLWSVDRMSDRAKIKLGLA